MYVFCSLGVLCACWSLLCDWCQFYVLITHRNNFITWTVTTILALSSSYCEFGAFYDDIRYMIVCLVLLHNYLRFCLRRSCVSFDDSSFTRMRAASRLIFQYLCGILWRLVFAVMWLCRHFLVLVLTKVLNCKVHCHCQCLSAWIVCLGWRSSALHLHSTVSSSSTVQHLQTLTATLARGGQSFIVCYLFLVICVWL